MAQNGTGGVRAAGLSPRFKYAARLLLLVGLLLMVTGLFAGSASATTTSVSHRQPTLNAHRATFQIPSNNPPHHVFVLSLWGISKKGPQHLLGKASGSSGELVVKVPAEPGCNFQVDVYSKAKFYSGFKRQLANCGRTVVTTTTKPVGTTTTTKAAGTTTTTKPKTTGSTGGSTGSTGSPGTSGTGSGSGGTGGGSGSTQPPTTVPGGKLAFTGAGLGMWITAALGALLILAGGLMLFYSSRYAVTA